MKKVKLFFILLLGILGANSVGAEMKMITKVITPPPQNKLPAAIGPQHYYIQVTNFFEETKVLDSVSRELCNSTALNYWFEYEIIDIPLPKYMNSSTSTNDFILEITGNPLLHFSSDKVFIHNDALDDPLVLRYYSIYVDIDYSDIVLRSTASYSIKALEQGAVPLKKIRYTCYPVDDYYSPVDPTKATKGELTVALENFTVQLGGKTCTLLSAKEQTVMMKDTTETALSQGEVLGGHFSLNLNCPTHVYAYAVFTDQTTPSNTSDILTLNNNSTAKGVGLKIYPANGGQAIKFNEAKTDALNITLAHKLDNSNSSSGYYKVNERYNVHYVKTGNISPGTVQGVTTVTFYYQ